MIQQKGIIVKAISGFYYVDCGGFVVPCRARGKFRLDGCVPLVGDHVAITALPDGSGRLDLVEERRNEFVRPSVANIELMIITASGITPRTDPFLIDSITAIAESKGVETLICINKCDADDYSELYDVYRLAGFDVMRVSALNGDGIKELSDFISGKVCAFTGNSGVGKSSILTAMEPGFKLKTGEVSEKLGRGRHTTRHVELLRMSNGALVADTPGFSSFDTERVEYIPKKQIERCFIEFADYIGKCRFQDCAHIKEIDCAVLEAVSQGKIPESRHRSYAALYDRAKDEPYRKK